MARDLLTDPDAPRRTPSRRTMVLIGLGIQLFCVLLGWYLLAASRMRTSPPQLAREILVPEDMVYGDTDVALKKGKRLPPVDVKKIAVATPAQLRDGEALFAAHCASCHGGQGRGDGPAGTALNPPPRDLTSPGGWKQGRRLSDIFRTVSRGLSGTQMPGFDYLPTEARFALAHHVGGLIPGGPRDTQASLDSLDVEFSLSEGAREPNVIPLNMAMDRIIAEAASVPPTPDAERAAALAAAEPRGAALFAQATHTDGIDRVGYLLTVDRSWVGHPDRLRSLATTGTPTNGFAAQAALLSDDDWPVLGRYLTLRYRPPK